MQPILSLSEGACAQTGLIVSVMGRTVAAAAKAADVFRKERLLIEVDIITSIF
jgi:hypothetical protein